MNTSDLQPLSESVKPLLAALSRIPEEELVATLKPRIEDYAKVFCADVADSARIAYEGLWSTPIKLKIAADQTELVVNPCPAGLLGEDHELSSHFPGGYRKIAQHLQPQRVWFAWEHRRPGESSGMAFDGLVWLDDHCAWFPKPYRVVSA